MGFRIQGLRLMVQVVDILRVGKGILISANSRFTLGLEVKLRVYRCFIGCRAYGPESRVLFFGAKACHEC